MIFSLAQPELMNIVNKNGEIFIGGSQEWYESGWHKNSGCGPVAASNLLWYMRRKQDKAIDYIELMCEMYNYVTPGMRGVNTSEMFTDGVLKYGSDNNLQITPQVLEIPQKKHTRPSVDIVMELIANALQSDSPVAFLNLSNGTVSALENWHWVTIIAVDTETMHVDICDYGKLLDINISEWLETSLLGGALVYFECT